MPPLNTLRSSCQSGSGRPPFAVCMFQILVVKEPLNPRPLGTAQSECLTTILMVAVREVSVICTNSKGRSGSYCKLL